MVQKFTTSRLAYTLVETLIVLGIVGGLFLLGGLKVQPLLQKNAEQVFWQELKDNWQLSETRAKSKQIGTSIRNVGNQYIRFESIDGNTRLRKDVTVPATLKIRYFGEVNMHQNGYVKPGTQRFYSTLTGKNYAMKIQLAWGGYYVATT